MKWILPIICALLSSCAAPVVSKVKRIHSLPPQGSGETFTITNVTKASDMELAFYNDIISKHLIKYGWRPSTTDKADYKVKFIAVYLGGVPYTVNDPIMASTGGGTTSFRGNYSSYTGGGYGTYSGTAYTPPRYQIIGMSSHTEILHGRMIFATIVDSEGRMVFQTDIISNGNTSDLFAIVPTMIDAMFYKFPGQTGQVFTRKTSRR